MLLGLGVMLNVMVLHCSALHVFSNELCHKFSIISNGNEIHYLLLKDSTCIYILFCYAKEVDCQGKKS